jgi:DNA-binding NtrC family response regulator
MNKLILIYDDDVEILSLCKIILERQSYRVETRSYCDDIIDDIDLLNPDIILMDLWIPEIGGENAIYLMKNNKNTKHLPIILFSANAEIEQIYKRTDANAYLKKPFNVADLINTIAKNILRDIEKYS